MGSVARRGAGITTRPRGWRTTIDATTSSTTETTDTSTTTGTGSTDTDDSTSSSDTTGSTSSTGDESSSAGDESSSSTGDDFACEAPPFPDASEPPKLAGNCPQTAESQWCLALMSGGVRAIGLDSQTTCQVALLQSNDIQNININGVGLACFVRQ